MRKAYLLSVLLALIQHISCDDLYVVNAPDDAIMFSDKLTSVKSSQLGGLLSAVSGVTPAKGTFEGVRVLSPFRYPRVISLITALVPDGELPTPGWRHYDVMGPADVDAVFHQLDRGLAKQPNTLPAIKLQTELEYSMPDTDASLNSTLPGEQRFLQEISLLDTASSRMSSQLDGRRAILVSLDSLPAVVAERGSDSAAKLLTEAVARYAERLSAASGGRAVTLFLTQPAHVRRVRSLLQEGEDVVDTPTKSSLNLAGVYSADYPVIFNILLLTSLFLIFILVSFSLMTAYMDPGKDSIIYRMTNPNMKKNN